MDEYCMYILGNMNLAAPMQITWLDAQETVFIFSVNNGFCPKPYVSGPVHCRRLCHQAKDLSLRLGPVQLGMVVVILDRKKKPMPMPSNLCFK